MTVAANETYHIPEQEIERAVALDEFQFNAANGEPEGAEFAESFEEACRVWGMDLSNGECRLMQVWQRSEERWFRIERTAHGVEAREVAV